MTTHARDAHTSATGTTTGTIAVGPTQRARIIRLIDDADADLSSTLALLVDNVRAPAQSEISLAQAVLTSGGRGVIVTSGGRVITIGHVMRARLTLALVRSLFTCPRASRPSCPAQENSKYRSDTCSITDRHTQKGWT